MEFSIQLGLAHCKVRVEPGNLDFRFPQDLFDNQRLLFTAWIETLHSLYIPPCTTLISRLTTDMPFALFSTATKKEQARGSLGVTCRVSGMDSTCDLEVPGPLRL
jgi:hypothetical protein